jgi:hypothetical protein
MPHYNQSTRQRIEDLDIGLRVETGAQAATTYQAQDVLTRLFTVTGRILVKQLYGEVTVALGSAGAPVIKFRAAWTTPVIAAADMSDNSADFSALDVGQRITLPGTANNTATAITASEGISYGTLNPQVIGLADGVGYIATLTSTAGCNAGSINWVINYVPMSTGANVETLVAIVT